MKEKTTGDNGVQREGFGERGEGKRQGALWS